MRRPDTYHHGDLRRALLAAARTILHEGGVEALTLREVARRAGVTTGAPYHHFADKSALIAALARQSLEELDQRAEDAIAHIADPVQQLRTLGMTYVLYAVEHPAEFRLMFRPEKGNPFGIEDPATEPVFRILIRVVGACRAASGSNDDRRDAAAIAAWGLVHGIASLLIDGPLVAFATNREHLHALVLDATERLSVV